MEWSVENNVSRPSRPIQAGPGAGKEEPSVRKNRFAILAVLSLLVAAASPALGGSVITNPFLGVTRIDRTETLPRTENMHIVEVNLAAPGIGFAVTPQGGTRDTVRQTTLDFLKQEQAQVAINTSFFAPFPSSDLNSALVGLAASAGNVYSPFEPQPIGAGMPDQSYAILPYAPGLNIDAANQAGIVHRDASYSDNKHVVEPVTLFNAVSGCAQIVTNGQTTIPTYSGTANGGLNPLNGYSDTNSWYNLLKSQTVIGLSQDDKTLVLFTVDVAGGSQGMTASEVANLLISDYGVYNAIELDNGGSTTMAMQDPNSGADRIINYVSDQYPTGRLVGCSLAVFAQPVPDPATMILLAGGAVTLLTTRKRNRIMKNRRHFSSLLMLLAAALAAAAAVLLSAAALASAAVITPWTDNFQTGSVQPDWTAPANVASAAGSLTWNVVDLGGGAYWYQNTMARTATSGAMTGQDSVLASNLGGSAASNAGKSFEVTAQLKANTQNYSALAGQNNSFGFRFLAADATTNNNSYIADMNFGPGNGGRIRIADFQGGSATVYASSTQTSQALISGWDTSSINKTWDMDLLGTYSAAGDLTLTLTVTQDDNLANTGTYSLWKNGDSLGNAGDVNLAASSNNVHTGQYFGIRDSMGSQSGGTATVSMNFDNFTVTPEPATLSLLALGGLALIRRRRVA
jgi:hypothetical protein